MKLIRLFISIVVISFVIGVGSAFNGNTSNDFMVEKEVEIQKTNEVEIKKELSTEKNEVIEQKKTPKDTMTEKIQKDVSAIQSETTQTEEIKPTKTEEVKTPIVEQKENIETKKEATAWEELGISEYDYYNSPMWKWATVDFSIKDYGTEEKTRSACIARGEELLEDGFGFSCSAINSYSGDYLGEMLETF